MTGWQLRDARFDDCAALAAIQVASYRRAYAGLLPEAYLDQFSAAEQEADWRDLLGSETADLLLVAANAQGTLLGYALGRLGNTGVPSYEAELVALHVRKEAQGQGLGTALLTAVAVRLRAAGAARLLLWTLAGNPARTLYERLGGVILAEKPFYANAEYGIDAREVAYGWADITAVCDLSGEDTED